MVYALRSVPESQQKKGNEPEPWHFEKKPFFQGDDAAFFNLIVMLAVAALLVWLIGGGQWVDSTVQWIGQLFE